MRNPRLIKIEVPCLFMIALMLVAAHSSTSADDACKSVVKIALTQTEPEYVMRVLGLCGGETASDARCGPWYADAPTGGESIQTPLGKGAAPRSARLLPVGIDLVVLYALDHSLIVAGEPNAVEHLQKLIKHFDVKPGKVGIDALFLQLSPDAAKRLLPELPPEASSSHVRLFSAFVSEHTKAKLRETLDSGEARKVSSMSVQTLNLHPAILKMEPKKSPDGMPSEPGTSLQMTVSPRINKADRSITLFEEVTVTEPEAPVAGHPEIPVTQTQSVSSTRRVASGETLALVASRGEKTCLVLITPRILD
ncbi:MAG TPA: hypothetical protein VFI02_01470 [Armatimonadota bacterium]|nr:hypothetical protein [Armatimonadota bacterium]